jgi:hypothetical protein
MAMKKPVDVKKDETKAPEIEKVENELIRYEFSDIELQKLGGDLSNFLDHVTRIEEEASSVAAGFKSEIKAIRLTINNVARWIREKYDMRKTDCYCYKDYRERKAYYWRCDKVELAEFERFNLDEVISHDGYGRYRPVKVRDLKHHELQKELSLEVYDSGSETIDGETVTVE